MKAAAFVVFLAAMLTVACAPKDYKPYYARGEAFGPEQQHARFTLERTACFGFCPVYKVSVDDRDILIFEGERFVAEEGGSVSKRLPKGSYDRLVEIAQAHRFTEFDPHYPNKAGDNCGPIATDQPTVIIAFDSRPVAHKVSLYQGCFEFDGRDRFNEMVLAMDAVLDVGDWIGPRDAFTGAQEE